MIGGRVDTPERDFFLDRMDSHQRLAPPFWVFLFLVVDLSVHLYRLVLAQNKPIRKWYEREGVRNKEGEEREGESNRAYYTFAPWPFALSQKIINALIFFFAHLGSTKKKAVCLPSSFSLSISYRPQGTLFFQCSANRSRTCLLSLPSLRSDLSWH